MRQSRFRDAAEGKNRTACLGVEFQIPNRGVIVCVLMPTNRAKAKRAAYLDNIAEEYLTLTS
jgi:hypothetical protein